MSYHYRSYQPDPKHQASLPKNSQLYSGSQDVYNSHSREIYSVPNINAGLPVMVPQPQYPMTQHAPVYHQPAPQHVPFSSQHYPLEIQPQLQYVSRHVDNRLRPDVVNQPQRSVYPLPPFPPPNHGPQPQFQSMQTAPHASIGRYELGQNKNPNATLSQGLGFRSNNVVIPVPPKPRHFQSRADNNVLDGFPPLKRIQGRTAHSNPNPRWEPIKAPTTNPRLHPQFSLFTQPRGSIKGSNSDWSTLKPGAVHILIPITSFPSSSPLDEYFQDAATHRHPVMYLPRSSHFSGKDTDPNACISFSVDGVPGPYLLDLAEERVTIDGENDQMLEPFGWRTTNLQIDWPGLSIPPEGFKAIDKNGLTVGRGELAVLVATRIAKLIIDTQRGYALPIDQIQKLDVSGKYWDIMKIDYRHLRLISVNYYEKVWVPVLALDIAACNV